MTYTNLAATLPSTPPRARFARLGAVAAEVLLVFLVFAAYGGWVPPDPNEPHYLGKAKHFWDPTWIPHDFFLDSADTHWLFYVTLGWLTRLGTLSAVAWTGRILTWGAQAWAWRRLSTAVAPSWGWAPVSACMFVLFNIELHMAGEWVVGGFEAKGIAYALVFWALGELLRNHWNRAWLLLGAASAFHVIVGGWTVIAAGVGWLLSRDERPRLPTMLPALVAGGVLSLPGLIPGLAVSQHVTPEVAAEAHRIYVFERLPHHLLPQTFAPWFLARHVLLIAGWAALAWTMATDAAMRRLRGCVCGAIAIAAVGGAISLAADGWPSIVAALLRFYWFRLSDALVPLGAALAVSAALARANFALPTRRTRFVWGCLAIVGAGVAWQLLAVVRAPFPRADALNKVADHEAWREACRWIQKNTPADAIVLTPRTAQTFKWYAGRSEVATWKDIPQNADDLVEWWRRINDLHATEGRVPDQRFYESLAERGAIPGELTKIRGFASREKYRAGYLLTAAEPKLDFAERDRLFVNRAYAVYRLVPDRAP